MPRSTCSVGVVVAVLDFVYFKACQHLAVPPGLGVLLPLPGRFPNRCVLLVGWLDSSYSEPPSAPLWKFLALAMFALRDCRSCGLL